MTALARVLLAVTVAATAALPGLVTAAPAEAAAFRYWTYWAGGPTGWTFASSGPAYRVPADGTVEGWRFAVSEVSGGDRPRADATGAFADLCGAVPAEPDRKRVAVVIDTGEPADAPPGETPPAPRGTCVVAEPDATGYAVLRAAASVRVEDGLVCGIDDYPARGCAEVVASSDAAAPTRAPQPSTAGPSRPASRSPAPTDTAPAAPATTTGPAGSAEPAITTEADGPPASPTGPDTTPSLAWSTSPSAVTGPEASPVALVTGGSAPPSDSGSPVPLVLVAAGAGLLGTAAWLRTRRRTE